MMRTDDEIIAEIKRLEHNDPFGFVTMPLMTVLPFERLHQWLKDDAVAEDLLIEDRDAASVTKRIREFLPNAWIKACNGKGIGSMQSIGMLRAWLWLLGEDEAAERIQNYGNYGKAQILAIALKFNVDLPRSQDLSEPVDPATLPWRQPETP